MEKPIKEDYGWVESTGFDSEPSGFMIEGGEEARERYKKLSQRGKKPVIKVVTGDGVIKGVDKLTVKEQEEQFIKCALDPIYFIETYLKIFDQTQGENGMIVPFKLFQFQKDLITEYLNNDFNIANKNKLKI